MNKTYFFLCAKKVESYFDNFINSEPENSIDWTFDNLEKKKKKDK